jgi:histidine triad (HIT) family protein
MQRTVFMDIVEGKIPSYKVYEDDSFFAFLDIYPRAKGHTLVIPKKPFRFVYDVPEFGKYWEAVYKITAAIQKGLQPTWVNYATFGLEVPHAHVHILPRYTPLDQDGQAVFPKEVLQFEKAEFEDIAAKIRGAL